MNKYSLSALVAAGLLAGGMSVSSASAADLGGNCCADLEERIAELEATTARKGTRKTSLEIWGLVNQAITGWDDGKRGNATIGYGNHNLQTRFGFRGNAKIGSEWSAGYSIVMDVGDQVSMRECGALGGPRGPAGVLQKGNVAQARGGGLTLRQTISTLPAGFGAENFAAGHVGVARFSHTDVEVALEGRTHRVGIRCCCFLACVLLLLFSRSLSRSVFVVQSFAIIVYNAVARLICVYFVFVGCVFFDAVIGKISFGIHY